MSDQELLEILKQGSKVWNTWRDMHQNEPINLSSADLSNTDLSNTNLCHANLSNTNLYHTNLSHANLSNATLSNAYLPNANLQDANCSFANLRSANLDRTNLNNANLHGSNLHGANLCSANFSKTNFHHATVWNTLFANVDLREALNIATMRHLGPSTIGVDTILRSKGDIPEAFLRKAGLSSLFIEYIQSIARKPIEYYTCFISYSTKDEDFVQRLYADLQNRGINCWFAPEDLKIGDRFADRIEESIRAYDKLLIVLSEHSVQSTWVEDEFRAALEKENRFRREQQLQKTVLFPVKLDNSIKDATSQWVSKIRRERHIGDFTRWKNHDLYLKSLDRLLRDLNKQ